MDITPTIDLQNVTELKGSNNARFYGLNLKKKCTSMNCFIAHPGGSSQ